MKKFRELCYVFLETVTFVLCYLKSYGVILIYNYFSL